MENPVEALKKYELTSEGKTVLMSGDIRKGESWLCKLDECLKTWLMLRLLQENWSTVVGAPNEILQVGRE